MITIVDSGGANLSSILFSLERLGVEARVSNQASVIKRSSHVILPGVGSAVSAMRRIHALGLALILRSLTQPVLGICLGMQLLFDSSEEGEVACLGIIPEVIKKLSSQDQRLVVPHMGWNKLHLIKSDPLLKNVPDQAYAYFVHSYAAPRGSYTTSYTNYGSSFSATVRLRNYSGAQFHPERSSELGSTLIKNFLEL